MPRGQKAKKNNERSSEEGEELATSPIASDTAELEEAETPEVEILPPEGEEENAPTLSDLPVDAFEPVDVPAAEPPIPSRGKSLVPLDALSSYLKEISRHPPLSREEEHETAVQYVTNKDMQAAYKLVVSNLWLVVKISREYEQAARNLLDLIQEGNIGLLEAVKSYDPYRGVRFPSYAVWWVRAYIIRYLIANWRMVKIGTTQAQRKLFFNLKKEKEKLEREGFSPEPKLLAQRLNVKEGEVIEMEQRLGAASEMSVDAPLGEQSENSMHQLLASAAPNAEEMLAKKEMQDLIIKSFDEFAEKLNEKERMIFRKRMLGEDKATLQEISEKLNISRERVRQIENKIREHLKKFMATRLGTDGDDSDFEVS